MSTAGPDRTRPGFDPTSVRFGSSDGLVPGVVQDVADGRVLMVAYLDAEALAATLATGQVHFHSRSRDALWRKGESSGHVLDLRAIALDCDGDALLLSVEPAGPTCHRGTRSCFDPEGPPLEVPDDASAATPAGPANQGFGWLETLWLTITDRVATRPAGSYTARLLDGGVDAVGRKVTEESTEVLLAAKDDATAEAAGRDRAITRAALAGEAADLVYHSLVLLAERGLAPAAVIDVLRTRHSS